jgi:ribosomal protein S18 acetylase RimI-like enzyme
MERIGQCHCGSLRVIATGEPERVYLCHCKACQRRTGTAFHYGATYLKERVHLDGDRKIYVRDAETGYRIRFHFCPCCGSTVYWEGDRNPAVCGVAVGAFEVGDFSPPSDSIWEESMHQWLALSQDIGHHQQNRPGPQAVAIRRFADRDTAQVRELVIVVNRLLSPPDLRDAFEAYIERALFEEIDRIPAYYGERGGGFWVALRGEKVVGTFGLERASETAMELRRMYVDPSARRQGIARQMLEFAEAECRRRNIARVELSTAEIQSAAIALYKSSGYSLAREETADIASNKTVGSGIRRYHFAKRL